MVIVDAHLDLAYNAVRGRRVLSPARQQTPDAEGIPSVGLPDLRAGGVGLICATIFCAPDSPTDAGYRTPDEAHVMALEQLRWYEQQTHARQMRLARTPDDLPSVASAVAADPNAAVASILLLEGADPIRTPQDVALFHHHGVRIVGLAWRRTRYAGGTGAPGPLTDAGVSLVAELDRFGVIHDASHLAEESFWQLLDISHGKVIASHSNCRAIVPTDRQLSDDMIRALAARGGVIGINFYDRFLIPPAEYGNRRATLADLTIHVAHVCDLLGDADHVGIGTDMDGGLGREQIPVEIETSADLPRVADALSTAGFPDAAIRGIMGGNWLKFFQTALPAG